MNIITITTNPAVDRTFTLKESLQVGATNRAMLINDSIGGKGINISRIMKLFNIDTIMLGFIGRKNGQILNNMLIDEELYHDMVTTECDTRMNIKISHDNTLTEIHEKGGPISREELMQLYKKFERIEKVDILFLCGSVPCSMKSNFYSNIINKTLMKDDAVKIIVDAEGDLLENALKTNNVYMIKPNKREFEILMKKRYEGEGWKEEIESDAKIISKHYNVRVLLTLSEFGALYIYKEYIERIDSPNVQINTHAGAGDTFLASFLISYLGLISKNTTGDVSKALSFAKVTVAYKMELEPDKLPAEEKISELYKQLLS